MAAKSRKNATINKKQVASMEGRWDGTREWRGVQGERDSIILGAIELGGGGETKVKSINLLNCVISQPIYKIK